MWKSTYKSLPLVALAALFTQTAPAASPDLTAALDAVDAKVITWRRDFHQNPELGNREVRTSGIVAEHLKRLGLSVKTGIAHTGVVGLLEGGRPGPVVGLRADMDALPVTEQVDDFLIRGLGEVDVVDADGAEPLRRVEADDIVGH